MDTVKTDFYNVLKKQIKFLEQQLNEIDCYYSTIPYYLRDFFHTVGTIHFARTYGLISHDEYDLLEDHVKDTSIRLNVLLNERLKWHSERLVEHLGKGIDARLVMVNNCNDIFRTLGWCFSDEDVDK